MKTAALLFGLARDFSHPAQTFRRYLPGVDAFMHTWRSPDASMLAGSHAGEELDRRTAHPDDLTRAFGLKALRMDDMLSSEILAELEMPLPRDIELGRRVVSARTSLARAHRSMIDSGESYDCVVVTRPDVVFLEPFPLEEPEEGTLYVPLVRNARGGKDVVGKMVARNPPGAVCDFVHDFLAFGRPEVISAYCGFLDRYLPIVRDYPLPDSPYFPERALAIYLKLELGLTVREFPFRHGLQRAGGYVKEFI